MSRAFRVSAGLVWPVSSAPIRNGALLVGDDGRIEAVAPGSRLPAPPGYASYEAPDAVLLPGLVNTHTHLELTHLRDAVPEPEFYDWIQEIRRRKSETTPGQFLDAARAGLREAWAAGITTLADTGDSGAAARALVELGGRGIAYQEVFGPHPDQAAEAMAGLRERVRDLRSVAGEAVTIGVSPHAPYSVSGRLFRDVAAWARAERLPLALHLGESKAETAFITRGAGLFADLWRGRSIPLPEPAVSPFVYADRLGVLGEGVLVIHGTQATAGDVALVKQRGACVALCPGSNARHSHGDPPAAAWLGAGVPAGVGTDSVASVDRMDLFAEARAVGWLASLGAAALIRLLTLDGAAALGMHASVGSLEPGKWADLCVSGVDGGGSDAAVAARVLDAGPSAVRATWVAGRLVNGSLPAARLLSSP